MGSLPGMEWMAGYRGMGAVYLGKGWFLTAGHAGMGVNRVSFQGKEWAINPESWREVRNPNTSQVDLRLFRVADSADLPAAGAKVSEAPLREGQDVILIGRGRLAREVVPTEQGYKAYLGDPGPMQGGKSRVMGFRKDHVAMGFTSDVFETLWQKGGAQAVDRDSGGGVFVLDAESGEVQLVGVLIAATQFRDADGVYVRFSTAEPRARSIAVDLAVYRKQMMQILHPRLPMWLVIGLICGGLLAVFFGGRELWFRWQERDIDSP